MARKLAPALEAAAEKVGKLGLLVLVLPAAKSPPESWGALGVVYDESVRLLAESKVQVLVSPKVTELIERGEIQGPVEPSVLARVRSLAKFDLLLTGVYSRGRVTRSVEFVLRDGRNDDIVWSRKVQLTEQDVQPRNNVPDLNQRVVKYVSSQFGHQVGNGQCWTLAAVACKEAGAHMTGALYYGRKLGPLDTPMPGDILQFEQVKFAGKGGSRSFRHHTAVIETVLAPTVVTVLHQNVGRAGKTVSRATLHLHEKSQGTLDLFRPRAKVVKAVEPGISKEPPAAVPAAISVPLSGGVALALRPIPRGSFKMGLVESVSAPLNQVTITKPFYLGVTEVTQAQWKALMGTNPAKVQADDLPISNVSWNDTQKFFDALNQSPAGQRLHFRLPTEAEWEHACRAGTENRFHFGDDALELVEYGWCEDNADGRAHRVAQLRPNRWGLYDLHGNVWELIHDFYTEHPAGDPPKDQVDPRGPTSGTTHVIRGGYFDSRPSACSCGHRAKITPAGKSDQTGFRVAAIGK